MKVSKNYEDWIPTREELDQIVQAYLAHAEGGSVSFCSMSVDSLTGETWSFENYEEFLDELGEGEFEGFSLVSEFGEEELDISVASYGTSVDAKLSERSALKMFLSKLDVIAP